MAAASTSTAAPTTITNAASIASFNRGPIPTVFSAPTSCLSTLTSVSGSGGLYFGQNRGTEFYLDSACYPSSTTTATGWDLYYYSPAVSCPSGWYTAQTMTSTFGGMSDVYITIGSATSAALCCPSGYTALSFQNQCNSMFSPGEHTILYKDPSQDPNGSWIVTSPPSTVPYSAAQGTSHSAWTVFGQGIPILYQASDQVAFTASKTSSSSSSSSSLPSSSSSSSTLSPFPTISNSPTSSPAGLSAIAKVGIGIGVIVGIIVLAIIAGFYMFILKRRKHVASTDAPMHELQGDRKIHELQSAQCAQKSELPGQDRPAIHEMYSDTREHNEARLVRSTPVRRSARTFLRAPW